MSTRKLIFDTDSPLGNTKKYTPFYVFLVGFVVSLVTLFKSLKHLNIDLTTTQNFISAVMFGCFTAFIGWFATRNIKEDFSANREFSFASAEKIFTPMMLFTACAMGFAHGFNDVANGIGPLAAVYSIVNSGGEVMQQSQLPI